MLNQKNHAHIPLKRDNILFVCPEKNFINTTLLGKEY